MSSSTPQQFNVGKLLSEFRNKHNRNKIEISKEQKILQSIEDLEKSLQIIKNRNRKTETKKNPQQQMVSSSIKKENIQKNNTPLKNKRKKKNITKNKKNNKKNVHQKINGNFSVFKNQTQIYSNFCQRQQDISQKKIGMSSSFKKPISMNNKFQEVLDMNSKRISAQRKSIMSSKRMFQDFRSEKKMNVFSSSNCNYSRVQKQLRDIKEENFIFFQLKQLKYQYFFHKFNQGKMQLKMNSQTQTISNNQNLISQTNDDFTQQVFDSYELIKSKTINEIDYYEQNDQQQNFTNMNEEKSTKSNSLKDNQENEQKENNQQLNQPIIQDNKNENKQLNGTDNHNQELEKIRQMLDVLKVKGDTYFKGKNYPAAIHCYQKALEYLNYEKKPSQKNVIVDKNLTINFLNNMTQCYINLNQGEYSKNLYPQNIKAQFRLGKSFELLNEPDKAKRIYKNVINETNDEQILQSFKQALRKIQLHELTLKKSMSKKLKNYSITIPVKQEKQKFMFSLHQRLFWQSLGFTLVISGAGQAMIRQQNSIFEKIGEYITSKDNGKLILKASCFFAACYFTCFALNKFRNKNSEKKSLDNQIIILNYLCLIKFFNYSISIYFQSLQIF